MISAEDELRLQRMRGTMLGCALGDAIGLFTEFLPKSQCIQFYGANPKFTFEHPPPPGKTSIHEDRHRSKFARGSWTDDTDQAILILLSFLRSGGVEVDPRDFAARLKFWLVQGLRQLDRLPLGIGRTVGSVVQDKEFVVDPAATALRAWEKSERNAAANGAVMRTGVVGALFWQDKEGVNGIERSMRVGMEIAATTHADPRCLISCAIVSGLVAAIIRDNLHSDADIDHVVQLSKEHLSKYWHSRPPLTQQHSDELDKYLGFKTLEEMELDDQGRIGYTYKCLASGVWALRQTLAQRPQTNEEGSVLFERLITQITMQGGDADTNCSVAGSLVGAYMSYNQLPPYWLKHLASRQWLVDKMDDAASLLDLLKSFGYVYANDDDTLIDGGKGTMSDAEVERRAMQLMLTMQERMKAQDGDGYHSRRKGRRKELGKGCIIS